MLVWATCHDCPVIEPLFDEAETALLRSALAGYTVDSVRAFLGLSGRSALARGDLAGVRRQLRGHDEPLATLLRLFLLGIPVSEGQARRALHPLPLAAAVAAGVLAQSGDSVRAELDIRPYGQGSAGELSADCSTGAPVPTPGEPDWWVVSDFGTEVGRGPLARDHVLGVGTAALTLAQAVPRLPVGRALDIGTGCGVQALHLSEHAAQVVATDFSTRALRLAATTAALSHQSWQLRAGSLLAPIAGEHFDLVVANPPFVVSAGTGGAGSYDYRDSRLAGDAVCESLISSLPGILAEGGSAHLLANWVIPTDGSWQDRVGGWLTGRGCDAWVWQRGVAGPGEYVAMWLRDAGLTPGMPDWNVRYDQWLDWFEGAGVVAIGMGLVSMWRTDSADPVLVLEDVPHAVEQPVGAHLTGWLERQRWLSRTGDEHLLASSLAPAPGLVRERSDLLGAQGSAASRLRQSHGMRWEVDVDDPIAALLAGCDGDRPLRDPVALLAASMHRPVGELVAAALPVVRDLVSRGFLIPAPG